STASWIASDKIIKERPQVVQKALNAIYGGVAYLAADANRATAVKLIADIDEIPETIAARELDGNLKKLSRTGEIKLEWMERALDMARLIGMKELAPAKEIFLDDFKPAPTTTCPSGAPSPSAPRHDTDPNHRHPAGSAGAGARRLGAAAASRHRQSPAAAATLPGVGRARQPHRPRQCAGSRGGD